MLTFQKFLLVVGCLVGNPPFREMHKQLASRAQAYVEAMPPAVSGDGGHDATFAVARTLVHGFGLPESDAWPILCAYNERCLPPWSEAELRHKLEDAGKLTRPAKAKGHLASAGSTASRSGLTGEAVAWDTTPRPHPQTHRRNRRTDLKRR